MARNGSGVYSLPQAAFVPGSTISSAAVNADFSDIALALTGSVAADGQTVMTGPLRLPDGSAGAPSLTFVAETTTGWHRPAGGQMSMALAGVDTFKFQAPSATVGFGITGLSGVVLAPIGMVATFAGATPPAGWLLCYGQAISRAGYPELFTAIGVAYGSGDGLNTFNMPDLRGRLVAFKDNMGGSAAGRITVGGANYDATILGNSGGVQSIALSVNQIPVHNHTFSGNTINLGSIGTDQVSVMQNPNNVGSAGGVGGLGTTSGQLTVTIPPFTPSGSISNKGGGFGFSMLNPTLIFNACIFAGRP